MIMQWRKGKRHVPFLYSNIILESQPEKQMLAGGEREPRDPANGPREDWQCKYTQQYLCVNREMAMLDI